MRILKSTQIKTPLGAMLAIADDQFLYLLEFENWKGKDREIKKLCRQLQAEVIPGDAKPLSSIQEELDRYFKGEKRTFQTPMLPVGTPFQKRVWDELKKIPFGETWSYAELAKAIGKPTAVRAVAGANAKNPLGVVVPCHRVINTGGKLGGYGGGLERKTWLLNHEQN